MKEEKSNVHAQETFLLIINVEISILLQYIYFVIYNPTVVCLMLSF